MGKFKDGLVALATKLLGSAPEAGSAGDVMAEIGDEADVSTVGRALIGANDAAAARTAVGATVTGAALIVAADAAAARAAIEAPGIAAAHSDSTATEVAGLVTDFNALLAKLRTAGVVAPEPEE